MKPTTALVLLASLASGALVYGFAVNDTRCTQQGSLKCELANGQGSGDANVTEKKLSGAALSALRQAAFQNSKLYSVAMSKSFDQATGFRPSNLTRERINGEEFCAALGGLRLISKTVRRQAVLLSPYNGLSERFALAGAPKVILELMEKWVEILHKLAVSLPTTQGFSSQMFCADCYVEYGKKTTSWLEQIGKKGERFSERHPARLALTNGLEKLAAAHLSLARLLHRNETTLINEKIPMEDTSGMAKLLHKKYGLNAGHSLRKFVRDHDPICPYPTGGQFSKTIWEWRSNSKGKNDFEKGVRVSGEPWDPSDNSPKDNRDD